MKENRPEQRIKFRTRKQSESKSLRRFALILVAVLIFGGAVSVFAFLKNYNFDLSEVFEGTRENTEETTTASAPLNIKNVNCDILLFCGPDNRERIDFISLIKVKMPENSFTVPIRQPLSPRFTTTGALTLSKPPSPSIRACLPTDTFISTTPRSR